MRAILHKKIKTYLEDSLHFFFPNQCLNCGIAIEKHGSLCHSCWKTLTFIENPFCPCCGHPFEISQDTSSQLCGRCINHPPLYDKSRSVFIYDETIKKMILRLKYGDQTNGLKTYGYWLKKTIHDLIPEIDMITSVPLHPFKQFTRKYNQANLLANSLYRQINQEAQSHIIFTPFLLKRIKYKSSQKQKSKTERLENVRNAFKLYSEKIDIKQKIVLLVDDVLTTGSTLEECTKTLKKKGAKKVYTLTLARVTLPHKI